MDRANFYNSTILAVYDQGAIDQYGLRIGDSLPGKCFASATSAQVAAQLYLQRAQFIRNTYKFQIGWDKALLEPMDIVLLTGSAGDSYLVREAVRVISIEENDNGDLTVEAEEVVTGTAAPPSATPPTPGTPLPSPTFVAAWGYWGGGNEPAAQNLGNWGLGNPYDYHWFPFPPGWNTGSGPTPAVGLTTTDPSVVVVFVAYEQYPVCSSFSTYCTGVVGVEQDPTPVVETVVGSSLGGFTRRAVQIMQPDYTNGFINGVMVIETWWAPAPNPLSNEVVTATMAGGPVLGFIGVVAVEGFSAAGVMNPWDFDQQLMNANWSTDPQTVGIQHAYTGHTRGALLQCAIMWPDTPYPGTDFTPLGYNVAGFSPAFAVSDIHQGGVPDGFAAIQMCCTTYTQQMVNFEIEGQLFTENGTLGVWPQWMLVADALFFS